MRGLPHIGHNFKIEFFEARSRDCSNLDGHQSLFNVVEHRHKCYSASGPTRFRGSQACLNFSLDLDRCVD